jgi:ketosteroid isomerase-like protein
MSSKIKFIKDMEAAAFSGNWEQFKTFLADDIYYFVGNKTELRSPQDIVDYLVQFLSKVLAIYNLEFLIAYENEDTVVTELSVKAVRVADNKQVVFPTVDIYRFADGKICDWRVYAIEPTHVGNVSVLTGVAPPKEKIAG